MTVTCCWVWGLPSVPEKEKQAPRDAEDSTFLLRGKEEEAGRNGRACVALALSAVCATCERLGASSLTSWVWNDVSREVWLCASECLFFNVRLCAQLPVFTCSLFPFLPPTMWSSFKSLCWWRCQPLIWRHGRREGKVGCLPARSATPRLLLCVWFCALPVSGGCSSSSRIPERRWEAGASPCCAITLDGVS